MFITKTSLPRRTFMRGMGTVLALPLLDAMVPAASALAQSAGRPVRRLGFVYIPMGANWMQWVPSAQGRITELSPSLQSLMPFLDQVTVISNLELRNAYTTGNHASANCAFLSCAQAKRTEGTDYELGITVDQIAAKAIGRETPIPSLELGTDLIAQVGNCDNGFACAYQNNLSWSSPTTPLPTEADPRVVFERLFGDGGPPERRRADLQRNGSILDWMTADMARLRRELGSVDRTRLMQYLDSVREVERRIQRAEQASANGITIDLDRPANVPTVWEDHVKLMFELQVLALQTDMTRVITFQLARETSTRTYPHIGVPEPHHPVSHHTNDPEKLAKLTKVNTFHVSLLAYYLEKLQSTPDGESNLLDQLTLVYGSGMSNSNLHVPHKLPVLLLGGGAGRIKGGRHVRFADETPLTNLYLTVLNQLGVPVERIGDSNGQMRELSELS